jgi:hypothetical protein
MKELVFFLEEESARALLSGLFPRVVSPECSVHPRFIVFQGKHDLEKNLERKLRYYLNPEARCIVLRDQDKDDCHTVKRSLRDCCQRAKRPTAVVRIACREIESFYLADLQAVESALCVGGLSRRQRSARYREPDSLHSPAEVFEQLTRGRYQKVSGSRAIAPYLDLDNRRSSSFCHLVAAIRKLSGS